MIDIRNKFVFTGNVLVNKVATNAMNSKKSRALINKTRRGKEEEEQVELQDIQEGEYVITRDTFTILSNGEKINLFKHTIRIQGEKPWTFFASLQCDAEEYNKEFYIWEGKDGKTEEQLMKEVVDCFDETLFSRIEELETTIEV